MAGVLGEEGPFPSMKDYLEDTLEDLYVFIGELSIDSKYMWDIHISSFSSTLHHHFEFKMDG